MQTFSSFGKAEPRGVGSEGSVRGWGGSEKVRPASVSGPHHLLLDTPLCVLWVFQSLMSWMRDVENPASGGHQASSLGVIGGGVPWGHNQKCEMFPLVA